MTSNQPSVDRKFIVRLAMACGCMLLGFTYIGFHWDQAMNGMSVKFTPWLILLPSFTAAVMVLMLPNEQLFNRKTAMACIAVLIIVTLAYAFPLAAIIISFCLILFVPLYKIVMTIQQNRMGMKIRGITKKHDDIHTMKTSTHNPPTQ